jgi:hypothetical protein
VSIQRIHHNLTNHPPKDDATGLRMETVRVYAKTLGRNIEQCCPESREKALALTNLEQSVMWAIAAIARNQ